MKMKWRCIFYMICQELLSAVLCTSLSTFDDNVVFHLKWPGSALTSDLAKVYDGEYLSMTSVDQEKYHCFLPSPLDQQEKTDIKHYQGQSPLQLLKPLFSQVTCSYRLEQFWTYELCHGRFIRQFHEENTVQGKFREEYYLGKHDPSSFDSEMYGDSHKHNEQEAAKLPKVKVEGNDHSYVMINMTDGTLCELIGQRRHSRILYVCYQDAQHEIYSFKEISTCEYEIIILTDILCSHPAFRVKPVIETDIYCLSVENSPVKPKRLNLMEKEIKEAYADEPDIKSEGYSMKGEPFVTVNEIANKPQPAPHDIKLIDDLLHGEYCLRGGTGWWKYEFCYGKKVEQYHEGLMLYFNHHRWWNCNSHTGVRTTILLGTWNADKHLIWISKNPQKRPKNGKYPRQVSHMYTDGSFCEEVQRPRYVEVRLKCKDASGHPNAVSLYLLEVKTCEYILSVESPILCPLLETVDEYGLPQMIQD